MMDELKPNVKEGLVNLIFGIYGNEPIEVCDALEQIEVLQKNVDRVSIEKIVRFFLKDFISGVGKEGKWSNQSGGAEGEEKAQQTATWCRPFLNRQRCAF
jgi:hypothetical protein